MLQLHSQPEASGTGKRLRINPGEGRGPAGLLTQEKAEQQQAEHVAMHPNLVSSVTPKRHILPATHHPSGLKSPVMGWFASGGLCQGQALHPSAWHFASGQRLQL